MNDKVSDDPQAIRCPACESVKVQSRTIDAEFPYREGESAVLLTVQWLAYRCATCELEFVGSDAEDLKHAAVCRHLGIFTPADVTAIRTSYGMSRAKFAQATKIGAATLGRWERGELIQNPAHDQFLFLLTFPENLERLITRGSATIDATFSPEKHLGYNADRQKFKSLSKLQKLATARKKASAFRLYNPKAA